jgi:hypothetical protein
VTHYVGATGRAQLRSDSRKELRRAERDRRLAQDWFLLDEEAWRTGGGK